MSEFKIQNNNNVCNNKQNISETIDETINQIDSDTNITLNDKNNNFSLENINPKDDNFQIKDNIKTERNSNNNEDILSNPIFTKQENKTELYKTVDINKLIIEISKNDINNRYNSPDNVVTNNQNNNYLYNMPENLNEAPYNQPIVNQNKQQEINILKNEMESHENNNNDKCCGENFCFYCCIECITGCCLTLFGSSSH